MHVRPLAVSRLLSVAVAGLCLGASPAALAVSPGVTFLAIPSRTDMTYDNSSHVLYVTAGSSLIRYNVATATYLPAVNLGGSLTTIDLSPDRTTLAVGDSSSNSTQNWVHLVNAATGAHAPVLFDKAFAEGGTYSVAYDSAGKLLVTSNYNGSGWVPLRKYDPVTNTAAVIGNPRQSSMLAPSADRNTIGLVEANISSGPLDRYSAGTATLQGYAGTGWFTFEVATSRNGSQFAVPTYGGTFMYNYPSTTAAATIGTYADNGPIGAVYSPNSDVVYFSWYNWNHASDEIRAYSTSTFQLLNTWHVGGTFDWVGNGALNEGRLKISPDGSLLFATVDGGVAIVPVPEPSGALLLALAAVGLVRRRRRGD
jgi:hypothetical protein